jgi:hypothetical protein
MATYITEITNIPDEINVGTLIDFSDSLRIQLEDIKEKVNESYFLKIDNNILIILIRLSGGRTSISLKVETIREREVLYLAELLSHILLGKNTINKELELFFKLN